MKGGWDMNLVLMIAALAGSPIAEWAALNAPALPFRAPSELIAMLPENLRSDRFDTGIKKLERERILDSFAGRRMIVTVEVSNIRASGQLISRSMADRGMENYRLDCIFAAQINPGMQHFLAEFEVGDKIEVDGVFEKMQYEPGKYRDGSAWVFLRDCNVRRPETKK